MQNSEKSIWQGIASFVFIVIAVVGAGLMASLIYMKYTGWQIEESHERVRSLMSAVDINPPEAIEERVVLSEFRANDPKITDSAAYWLYSLSFHEKSGEFEKAQEEFEEAVRILPPNDLRLLLQMKVISPQAKGIPVYSYKFPNGRKVDLVACYEELEETYQDLLKGASEETGSLLGGIRMMNYLMFPEFFGMSCSQLGAFKKA